MPVKVGLTVLSPLLLDATVVVVTVEIMVVVIYEFVMKVVGPLLIVTTSPLPKIYDTVRAHIFFPSIEETYVVDNAGGLNELAVENRLYKSSGDDGCRRRTDSIGTVGHGCDGLSVRGGDSDGLQKERRFWPHGGGQTAKTHEC